VFALLAFLAALLGFLFNSLAVHTNAWFSPMSLGLLALAFLALHLAPLATGVPSWLQRR